MGGGETRAPARGQWARDSAPWAAETGEEGWAGWGELTLRVQSRAGKRGGLFSHAHAQLLTQTHTHPFSLAVPPTPLPAPGLM